MATPITKLLLRNIGIALYGVDWEAQLAQRRGVDKRKVHRWHIGSSPIPESLWLQLRVEIRLRKLELEELLDQLPK
jgi:hypothetical protein